MWISWCEGCYLMAASFPFMNPIKYSSIMCCLYACIIELNTWLGDSECKTFEALKSPLEFLCHYAYSLRDYSLPEPFPFVQRDCRRSRVFLYLAANLTVFCVFWRFELRPHCRFLSIRDLWCFWQSLKWKVIFTLVWCWMKSDLLLRWFCSMISKAFIFTLQRWMLNAW